MSIARHHAEWLSLIEVSGPFFSLPVVQRAFPHGLNDLEPGLTGELRAAYADWQENAPDTAATHAAWVQYVLHRLLGFSPDLITSGQTLPPGLEARVDTFHETLRPDFAIIPPADRTDRRPVLLVRVYPPGQRLESPLMGSVWKASPAARMMELLHATGLPLGMLTNGEEWQLVFAPKNESTGFASWYADLWLQEPLTLRAFQSLLSQDRFFGVADDDTPAALLQASLKDQHEVTNSLGAQVRQAVELLVRDFDRLDLESGRTLLAGLSPAEIYDASLTVMMRLVFLFCAEEKGLLRLGEAFYDTHYAVSTLREQLREIADQRGEEVLERRSDAWCRLCATFRAVHGGVTHDAMLLPAYGGTLFDPDRYPFLEGRPPGTQWCITPAQPPHINNRVALHLLEALQILRTKVPGGGPAEARRLSFRSLDIEQLGHVYEGLLDHTARRAASFTLGLEGSSKAPAPLITLNDLEALVAKGNDAFLDNLEERTGRSRTALEKALGLRSANANPRAKKGATNNDQSPLPSEIHNPQSETEDHALAVACQYDPRLTARVRPFAGLLRRDSFDQIVLIPEESLHVAPGTQRRSTGTHHTPRVLSEPLVKHTLEPLVYLGPAEGLPGEQWKLKSPREILAIKVCDLAMGCGTLLVAVCRYLSERLVEAWEIAENANPGMFLATPEGDFSAGHPAERLIPADPAERLAIARRYVADRCLYGVDINPMAVEMAKLSLWLITLQRDRPFTFLDHALKCGDSLLGVSSVQQIENFSLRPGDRQVTFATANLFRYVDEASAKRRALEDLPSNDHTQIETKNRLHAEAEAATAKVKAVADCLIASELRGLDGGAYEEQRTAEAEKVQLLMKRDADASLNSQTPTISQLSAHAREQLRGRRPFHWAVEFPEVFANGGFDAFVGNPPFMGGQKISGELGTEYRDYLVERLANSQRGSADFCAYFFLRVHSLLNPTHSLAGLIATNTISQGDTREVGLDQITAAGTGIPRAVPSRPWPGIAALEVAHVWLRRGPWMGELLLNGRVVSGITPFLTEPGHARGKPLRLIANAEKCFQGAIVLGMGFVLSSEEAQRLIQKDPRNSRVLFPYLGGDDINSRFDQSPSRWVVNFHDWPAERSAEGKWSTASLEQKQEWLKTGRVPADFPDAVAADFPDCFEIVETLVRKERQSNNRELYRRLWWIYGERRPGLYEALKTVSRFFVRPLTSKHHGFIAVTPGLVVNQTTVSVVIEDWALFTVLQSDVHYVWALEYGNKLENRPQYTHGDCFETFPFPISYGSLSIIGSWLHEFRRQITLARQEGLTQTYNRFHDRGEQSADIARLRALHVEMDQAVAAAYGWSDLDLGHGFHPTKQGERYTLSEPARRAVLDRLLALNHQRFEEEVNAGLHEKKKKPTQKPPSPKPMPPATQALETQPQPPQQAELF